MFAKSVFHDDTYFVCIHDTWYFCGFQEAGIRAERSFGEGSASPEAVGEQAVDGGGRMPGERGIISDSAEAGDRRTVGAGVEIRPRGHKPRLANQQTEVVGLRGLGWSYARIGDKLGVNASTVRGSVTRWEAV